MMFPKYAFYIFLAAAIIVLILPNALRSLHDNQTLPGEEPYYHARIASQILKGSTLFQDAFVQGRQYFLNPYHFVLAAFSLPFGIITASKIVPVLMGIASFCLFYILLRKFKLRKTVIFSVLFVFILSPVFTYYFTVSTPLCLAILLNLLGLYFFAKNSKPCVFLAAIFFSIAAFLGIFHAIVSAAIIIFYTCHDKKKLASAYILLAILSLIVLSQGIPAYLQQESANFVNSNKIAEFVSDFGGFGGFSIFTLLLAMIGLVGLWKYKKEHYLLYAAAICLVVYSFFSKDAVIYASFILAIFAGFAFSGLTQMRWRLSQVRGFSLFVLFCGLLFSMIAHAVALSELAPNDEIKDALLWLGHRSNPDDVVFSHYSNGFWIEFWAGLPVVMDGLFASTPNVNAIYIDSNAVFYSNDIRMTREILSRHNVRYVFMTKDMLYGPVSAGEGQGLAFLLSNSETFKKRYANPYCEIYEYIYKEK